MVPSRSKSAAQRAQLVANENGRLRDRAQKSLSSQLVEVFNLRKVFEAEASRDLLRQAGLRSERHLVSYLAARAAVPIEEANGLKFHTQHLTGGQAHFGINFVPSLLSAREGGADLVNIAQVFERSAMREISWKDTGITSPADLAGKNVAVWFGGNEFELLATLAYLLRLAPVFSLRGGTREILRGMIARGLGLR